MTGQEMMQSRSVHTFAKDVLAEAMQHDPVDAIEDLELVLEVLRDERTATVVSEDLSHDERLEKILAAPRR